MLLYGLQTWKVCMKSSVELIPKSRTDPNTGNCRAVLPLTQHQWTTKVISFFCVKFTWWVIWNSWYLGRSEIFSSFMLVFHLLLCRCPEEECGEEFHSKLGLTRHMLGHKKRDNLALTCPVDGCGKTFKWKSRYDVHLRSHNGGSMVAFCIATITD